MEWKTTDRLVPYEEALGFMEDRVAALAGGEGEECIWLLEHPPLYTAGTSADEADLLTADRFPVDCDGCLAHPLDQRSHESQPTPR